MPRRKYRCTMHSHRSPSRARMLQLAVLESALAEMELGSAPLAEPESAAAKAQESAPLAELVSAAAMALQWAAAMVSEQDHLKPQPARTNSGYPAHL